MHQGRRRRGRPASASEHDAGERRFPFWSCVRIPRASSHLPMVSEGTSDSRTACCSVPAIDAFDITQRNRSFNSTVMPDEL
jgi:hypothetical protein